MCGGFEYFLSKKPLKININIIMKTLGILGGVGPQTTAEVYLSVVRQLRERSGGKYPPILIYNLPFPYSFEQEIIVEGKNLEKMLPYLLEGAKILEKSGANLGILPCNTLHKFIDEIRNSVSFPFLSILEETAFELKNKKIKKVGMLATESTIQSKLYEAVLSENDINIVYPNRAEQDDINHIIIELLEEHNTDQGHEKIKAICNRLYHSGAECILLACTDLQLAVVDMKIDIPVIDTAQVIIDASVREMTQ